MEPVPEVRKDQYWIDKDGGLHFMKRDGTPVILVRSIEGEVDLSV